MNHFWAKVYVLTTTVVLGFLPNTLAQKRSYCHFSEQEWSRQLLVLSSESEYLSASRELARCPQSEIHLKRKLDVLSKAVGAASRASVQVILEELKNSKITLNASSAHVLKQVIALIDKITSIAPIDAEFIKSLITSSNAWVAQDQAPQPWNRDWVHMLTRLSPAFGMSSFFADRLQTLPLAETAKKSPEEALSMTKAACIYLRLQNRIAECEKHLNKLLQAYEVDSFLYSLVVLEKTKNIRDLGDPRKAYDVFQKTRKKIQSTGDKATIRWLELYVAEMALAVNRVDEAFAALELHEKKIRTETTTFPWERLYAKTLRLQVLRRKNKLREAIQYAALIKKEYGPKMTGSLQAWIWFDLERLYVYALLGEKERVKETAQSLIAQIEKIPVLHFLREIPLEIMSDRLIKKIQNLPNVTKNLGPNHHVYLDVLSLFELLNKEKIDRPAEKFIVTECLIYSQRGELVRQYDGSQCLFLPDGSWIARDRKTREVFLKDPLFREKWRIHRHFHHTFNILSDGNFLGLSSSIRKYKGQLMRFDVVVKINPAGKIIASYDFFENRHDIKQKLKPPLTDGFVMSWENDFFPKVKQEYSHANSAYEVVENSLSPKNPAFAKGNIIVHAGGLDNFFILDKNLKSILWSGRYSPEVGKTVAFNHDAQVLSNGNIALYVNQLKVEDETYSLLVEIDAQTLKPVWQHMESPKPRFSSEVCGGLHVLSDGRIIYTDTTTQGAIKIIRRDGSLIKSFSTMDLGFKILNAREVDLEEFFKRNRGL